MSKEWPSWPDLKWYPRSPKRMLAMLRGLTLEEAGAVDALEDLIFATGNQLVDDPRYIAGNLGVDLRIWKRLRAAAIAKAGFYVFEQVGGPGLLRSCHCDEGVEAALARMESARDAGFKSGISRRYKSNVRTYKNKDLLRTRAGTDVRTPVRTDDQTIDKSLHNLPSEDCGETLLNPEQQRDFVAQLRREIGRPLKAFVFERAKISPPKKIIYGQDQAHLHNVAIDNYGSDLERLGYQVVLRQAA